ncbi:MAG TPA: hypothetical protein VGY77_02445 [Gemmataceae bacterium]|nr:hypothetical protein [Gemmataceae bacterium]
MRARSGTLLVVFCLMAFDVQAIEPPQEPMDPPVRLKKKEKPEMPENGARPPELSKPKESKPAAEPADSINLEKDAADILARVSKNMRVSEDRLAAKDAGEGTRDIQRDIIKDLDALIEKTKRQQQQHQQHQSSSSSSTGKNNRRQSDSRNPSRQNQGSLTRKPDAAATQNDAMGNQAGMGGKGQKGSLNRIADLYKDIWGHLPETLRQEMDQYSREKFMDKYSEMLKQYYATIAEKGHRKGE